MLKQQPPLDPVLQRAWDAFHDSPRHAAVGDAIPAYDADDISHRITLESIKRTLDAFGIGAEVASGA